MTPDQQAHEARIEATRQKLIAAVPAQQRAYWEQMEAQLRERDTVVMDDLERARMARVGL